MKTLLSITALMVTGSIFASCQSGTYRITGSGDMLQDGDTLFLTSDFMTGAPVDTVIAQAGKFEMTGTADSTFMCLIYSKKNQEVMSSPFFIEPGTIKLTLSDNPKDRKVSGSSLNNEWQEMNDSLSHIGLQFSMMAENMATNNLTAEEAKALNEKQQKLIRQWQDIVFRYAKKNVDNELGYFLVTQYYDPECKDAASKQQLISMLPKKMQERSLVKAIQARLNSSKATAEGSKMNDFTMNDINERPMSILSEIAKNKITVIDFWASWCGPCLREMPSMVEMYKKHKDSGLGIIGISLDSRKTDWENATKRFSIEWPQISDLNGWNNAAAQMFNVQSIPYTIVVSSDGTILKKGLRGSELEEFVSEKLK